MLTRLIRQSSLGLSLGAALAATLAGCGGQPTETDQAVVIPEAGVSVASRAPTTAAPAGASPASATAETLSFSRRRARRPSRASRAPKTRSTPRSSRR